MNYIVLSITCRDLGEAKKIGDILLRARLIACANYVPIQSAYWWHDAIEEGAEVVIVAKTRSDWYDRLVELVEQHHSYDTPCIAAWPLGHINEKYMRWLEGELSGDSTARR